MRAVHLIDQLPVLNDADTWQALHPKRLRQRLVTRYVGQRQHELAAVLAGECLEHSARFLCGRQLIRPEQHDDRNLTRPFDNIGLKILRGDVEYRARFCHVRSNVEIVGARFYLRRNAGLNRPSAQRRRVVDASSRRLTEHRSDFTQNFVVFKTSSRRRDAALR